MTSTKVHPFEKVGLGKAPFRVDGYTESRYQACPGAPLQPGSSCDYCGTNGYGGAYKMRVRSADGWQVWCTVPTALVDAAWDARESRDEQPSGSVDGLEVEFTATLEPSSDDPFFAFGKRPSKAKLISL